MRPFTIRPALCALISGLLLSACGGPPEAPVEESLATQEAALCSGLSVTSLTVAGVSTWQGEMAGSGDWTVSSGANAVRLEYLVDGAQVSFEERVGASGTWYFSKSGISCGPHSFQVRAYPMVIDSAGNRTTCSTSPTLSAISYPSEPCPPLNTSLSCSRYSPTLLQCTGTASGGSGSYTAHWQEVYEGYPMPWFTGPMTQYFGCATKAASGCQWGPMGEGAATQVCAPEQLQIQFKVLDSVGTWSTVHASSTYLCF